MVAFNTPWVAKRAPLLTAQSAFYRSVAFQFNRLACLIPLVSWLLIEMEAKGTSAFERK
jgi:hypothetical protein